MSTSVYTGLNPFNFIRKHFLQICLWGVSYVRGYLLTYLLTYSMEQSPSWEANWFVSSQEITRVLWNPMVPHRTHKHPPRIPILSQPNPVLTPTSHFLKIRPNITFPPTPGSPQRSLSLRFPHQNTVHTSPFPHTCYMAMYAVTAIFNSLSVRGRSRYTADFDKQIYVP
jgi:hypothetical protein